MRKLKKAPHSKIPWNVFLEKDKPPKIQDAKGTTIAECPTTFEETPWKVAVCNARFIADACSAHEKLAQACDQAAGVLLARMKLCQRQGCHFALSPCSDCKPMADAVGACACVLKALGHLQ